MRDYYTYIQHDLITNKNKIVSDELKKHFVTEDGDVSLLDTKDTFTAIYTHNIDIESFKKLLLYIGINFMGNYNGPGITSVNLICDETFTYIPDIPNTKSMSIRNIIYSPNKEVKNTIDGYNRSILNLDTRMEDLQKKIITKYIIIMVI
jgi:hypothetical protein